MASTLTRNIPNAITCCNLVSGCVATYYAFFGLFETAFLFIVVGAVFDFLDGMSARLLGVSSAIGKELDSLADDVTFGVAPSAMVFAVLNVSSWPSGLGWAASVLPFVAFVMAAFSALRLAKFNLDKRQASSFIGMPTPANTLFWASFIVGMGDMLASSAFGVVVILVLLALSCWLLVSEIPMFALKFKTWGWRGNEVKYVFVMGCIALVLLFGVSGVSASIVWYLLLSVVDRYRQR